MRNPPRVAIILLNWNSYEDTANCISSIQEIEYNNYFTIIVDNGSTDSSGEQLSEEFEDCAVIFNDDNLGFSGGCNVGIEHALEESAEYILLLNNDMTVDQNFLRPLVATAEQHERVAAVGGVIYEGKTDKIWDAGGKMRPYIANVKRHTKIQSPTEYRTEFVTCAQALLTREFLEENKLDEEFFFGVEEIELNWRANQNDWKLFINPNSEVYHNVGGATEEMYAGEELFSSFQKYHNTRGRFYFASKNLTSVQAFTYYFSAAFIYPIFYFWLGLRYNRWDILRAHSVSIFDYLFTGTVRKPKDF